MRVVFFAASACPSTPRLVLRPRRGWRALADRLDDLPGGEVEQIVAHGHGLRHRLCLQHPTARVEVVVNDTFTEFTRLLGVAISHP